MKSKHLLLMLLLALLAPWAARAQETVTIGEGTGTSYNVPFNSLYGYSFTEMVYPATAITVDDETVAGTITSVSFYLGTANTNADLTNEYDLYMKNVSRETFSGNTDFETVTAADVVFSGEWTIPQNYTGWLTITLDTPFEYDGESNLMIALHEKTEDYSSRYFRYTSVTNSVIQGYNDNINPNPLDMGSYTGSKAVRNYLPNIQLVITPAVAGSCEKPETIEVVNITTNTALVNWSYVNASFDVEYKKSTETDWTIFQTGGGQNVMLVNLDPATTYNVHVRSNCGGEVSGWKTANFTTADPCAAPTDLQITNITPNSASLSWTAGYQETSWTVKYKKSAEAWDDAIVETATGTPTFALSHLDGLTTYNVQVYNCENYVSANFTTAAGIPLNEAFGTATPTGWAQYSGLLSDVMGGTALTSGSGWAFGQHDGVFDDHARTNIYGTACKKWLVMPTLLMEDNVQLLFDLAYTKYVYSGTAGNPDQTGGDDKFVVLITTDNMATWTILRQWDNAGSEYVLNDLTPTPITVAFDLSSYAGQNIAIAFYAESTVSNADNNLHIDNVSIDYIPNCAKPTGLAKSDVTAHEATITWTSDASAWQICVNDDEENLIDVTETSYQLTGLDGSTAYSVKVRANCGGTNSEWTNAVSFTTLVSCPVPTSFTTSNVGAHSVELSWASDASEWVVAYKKTADENFTEVPVTEKPYTLEGLDPEINYTVKVKAVCGGIDGESQYTTTRSFTTTVACPAPSTPIVSNLTATSATISWTELGDGTSWFISLDGEDDNLIEVDETTYTFPALETETVHTVKVKSNCGTAWSSEVSFEPTAKLVIGSGTATNGNLPTNTNYDYSYTQQIYTTEELGNAGVFESIDFYMTSTTAYTRNLDIYMVSTDKESFTSNTDWIVPTAADLVFSGDVDFTGNSWTTITLDEPFVYNGTQNVAIIVDDNTNDWSSRAFRVFTASAQQALYKYQDNTDLPIDYTGSGTLTTSKNQIRILKSEMSNCMKPMQLTSTEIGPDFIKLSWTENGASTEWVVVYNGNTTTANTNTNFMLQGLDNETEYTITVYPTCDPTLVSSAITITTLAGCPAPQNVVITNIGSHSATVTWTGFSDNYTVTLGQESTPVEILNVDFSDGIPSDWDNTSAYPWEVTTDGYIQTTNAGVGSSTSSLSVEVTFPVDGTITFDAECRGEGTGTFWDHCDFYIDGNRVFYHGEDLTNAGWNTYTFVVTAGTHTFTWSYTKDSSVDPDGDYFAIDNVLASYTTVNWGTPVTGILNEEYEAENLAPETRYFVKVQGFCGQTPSEESAIATFTTEIACPAPTNLDYANVTAHTADLTWNVNGNTTTDYVLIQNGTESNIVVTIDEGVASYTIQNLVGETDYTVSVKANCGSEDGYSTESNEVTFTTLEACAKPTDLEAIDITRHEATLTWDGTASSYNVRYRVLTATNGVTEDFEGSVDGWTSIDADGDGYNWELINTVPAHDGEYCVLSASYDGVALTPDNYLVSPLVALGGSISFYANAQDADWPSEHFGVAVSTTSNTDPDAFILLNEWTMTAAGTPAGAKDQGAWGLYTVDLSAYAGQTGYVAIRHFNCTDLFRLNVDDIVITAPTGIVEPDWIEATVSTNSMDIDELAAGTLYEFEVQSDCGAEGTSNWVHSTFATEIGCLPVTDLAVTATTSTSATITWNAGTGTAWQVYLYDNNDNVLSGYPVDVTTATCTFNGLTANTPYKAGVKNNCGGVDISAEVFVSMRTDCNIITTLPYEESFEGAERYCWTLDGFAAENAAGHAHTDNYYIYANGYDATHMAIQPDIDAEISGLAMNFWYKCRYENAYETLKVGYLTDVNDYSSFVEVGSIVMTAANNGVYTQSQDFFFTGAPAGSRIAISYVSSGTNFNNMVFIDDVKISEPSTITKNIVAKNWYALSSPVNTPNVTDVTNLTVDDYDFYRYNEELAKWENVKYHTDFTAFENGRGYIYRRSNGATLTFTGVPNTSVSYTLTAERSGDLQGFNLLGNPYTTPYTYNDLCYALTDKGTWMAKIDYSIPVCEAVLVQVDETAPFNFPVTNSKSAPKAAQALAFTVSGNGYEDVTYAMLEDGKGLNKVAHLADEAPALSIPVDGSNYAIAYLGYEVESFPLTLNATAGEYTIALNNQISGLSYCHLLDKVTGKETDLLKGAYTFKANGNSDRFTVLLNASLENGEIAIWNGNSWIVNGEGTLQVFDVMGRRVYNQEVAGQSSLNTDELATGVYVIRLGEKSQKIVVK